MITQPIIERKEPLDFVYTFKFQGSTPITDWLNERGLKQKYVGLVNIPNMHDIYGAYYDFVNHCLNEKDWEKNEGFLTFVKEYSGSEDQIKWLENQKPIGYGGIVGEDGKSTEIRLSSVEKGVFPICHVSYNESGYTKHCVQYKNQKTWEKERNPKRYESNLNKSYDSKNMMHMFRMIHMANEIALGEGIILERTWDREFLLNVRNHKYEYDELMEILMKDKEEMEKSMKNSTIQDKIDVNFVNELLIEIRKKQLNIF